MKNGLVSLANRWYFSSIENHKDISLLFYQCIFLIFLYNMLNILDNIQKHTDSWFLLVYSAWLKIFFFFGKRFHRLTKMCNLIFKSRNMAQLISQLIHLFYKAFIFFFCVKILCRTVRKMSSELKMDNYFIH